MIPKYINAALSLLCPDPSFSLRAYGEALVRETAGFGFRVELSAQAAPRTGPIESAFLKANTLRQLVVAEVNTKLLDLVHPHTTLQIRLEVDTDPVPLTPPRLLELLAGAIAALDVSSARTEVSPFLLDPCSLDVWSRDFFLSVAARIQSV